MAISHDQGNLFKRLIFVKGFMMKRSLILTAALVMGYAAPASAVVCTSSGFAGGMPPVVSSLNISDGMGNDVDITDFSTKTVEASDPDNSSAVTVIDEFEFGSAAISALSAAGISMTTGTIISGSSSDLQAEAVCD
jgi:hypothetical protein